MKRFSFREKRDMVKRDTEMEKVINRMYKRKNINKLKLKAKEQVLQ